MSEHSKFDLLGIIDNAYSKIKKTEGYVAIKEAEKNPNAHILNPRNTIEQIKFLYNLAKLQAQTVVHNPISPQNKRKTIQTLYIMSALEVAIEEHEGHTRKSGHPYIVHPIGVAIDFLQDEYIYHNKRELIYNAIVDRIPPIRLKKIIAQVLKRQKSENGKAKWKDEAKEEWHDKHDKEKTLIRIIDHQTTNQLAKIFRIKEAVFDAISRKVYDITKTRLYGDIGDEETHHIYDKLNLGGAALAILHDLPEETTRREIDESQKEAFNKRAQERCTEVYEKIAQRITQWGRSLGITLQDTQEYFRNYDKTLFALTKIEKYRRVIDLGENLKLSGPARRLAYHVKKSDCADNICDLAALNEIGTTKQLIKNAMFSLKFSIFTHYSGLSFVNANYRKLKISRNRFLNIVSQQIETYRRIIHNINPQENTRGIKEKIERAFYDYAKKRKNFKAERKEMSQIDYETQVERINTLSPQEIKKLFPGSLRDIAAIMDREKPTEEFFRSSELERILKLEIIRNLIDWAQQDKHHHLKRFAQKKNE